jgi:MoaE-MoaD fusion protein
MANRVQIRVLFFGMARDVAGLGEESADVPAGATLDQLFEQYAARFPGLRAMAGSLVLSVNAEFAPRGTKLNGGDEVAFLPPVSGGAGPYTQTAETPEGHFFGLTRQAIDTRELVGRLQRGEDGAVIIFEGVVRNNTRGRRTLFLDYECYEAMAIRMMEKIGCEIAGANAIGRIAMVHRLGRLQIGEASVVIVVTAPHRKPAFAAALEGINRLKSLVPIWKKEYFEDGDVWVEGEWDSSVLPR